MTASYDKLKSTLAVRTYADDPADATVARKIAWVPMGKNFLALCTFISGTGVLTFKIFAAVDSNGTTPTLVKAHADPTPADAAGDQVHLEVSAEEVKQALAGAQYVSVEMDNDAANDINAVTYVMEGGGVGGRFSYEGLTGDVIS
jgi:hypothetical protein